MAWNGTGTYTQTDGTYSGTGICAAQAGDGDAKIRASEMDALLEDHATAINACLAKNGENALTANLDAGGNRLTDITASANTDAGTYGKQLSSVAYDAGDDELDFTLQDGTVLTCDVSSLSSGTGGVDLTTAQTVAGVKTFSSASSLVEAKFNGPTKSKVTVPTPGANVTIDTTSANDFYLIVGTNTELTFTWPSAASDSELGANWGVKGEIQCVMTSASKTITINSATTSALDYSSEDGNHADSSGSISILTYNYKYINGTEICQFAWVATA